MGGVDARLRLILGIIGVVFAVGLGLAPRGTVAVSTPTGTASEPQYLSFWVGTLAVSGLLVYIFAGAIALWAWWPRDFDWPPRPSALPKYLTTDPRLIKWIEVNEMVDAYDRNSRELKRKFDGFRWAISASTIATLLLTAAVIIELILYTRAWA